jgi:pimeloyl-ACP methyl ester carboxylesterase
MASSIRNIRGATRLTFDCLAGITNTVMQMHGAVARRSSPFSNARLAGDEPALGAISKAVYSSIQSVLHGLREGTDKSFSLLPGESSNSPNSPGRGLAFQSILNGVCGDHLESTDNVLAAPMRFTTPEIIPDLVETDLQAAIPDASPDIAVYVHGLCLSPQSWFPDNHLSISHKLKESAGLTPLYLQYNTGRHISTNGRDLSAQLHKLVEAWPVSVESINLVGHSMGGLVIRSACWYAEQDGYAWPDYLKRVLFLGTPHHGAPLEKAGHLLTSAMHASPYLAPLDFGKHRSAGIKDLRFGNLLDEDWQGHTPGKRMPDTRRPVPLLPSVNYYVIAATIGRDQNDLRGQAFGDLLVRSGSAIGHHKDQQRVLEIHPDHCRVLQRRNHFDLLSDPAAQDQIVEWFTIKPLPIVL